MEDLFSKPKVLIDMEEYNHLKKVEQDNFWKPLSEKTPENGDNVFLSNGEIYGIGYREYDEWRFESGVFFVPTHYSEIKLCPKPPSEIIDNDDLPF